MEKHEVQSFLTSDMEPSRIKEHENERKHLKNCESLLKIDETANSTNKKKCLENTRGLLKSANQKYAFLVICVIIFVLRTFIEPASLSPSLSSTSKDINEPVYVSPSLLLTSEDINEPAYFKDHFLNYNSKNETKIDSLSRTDTVTYGFLHMQKTGGTTINGFLATHYERVCGNKGYSYSYHSNNKRQRRNQKKVTNRILTRTESVHNHGHFLQHSMKMIGFHNCDYIANEVGATFWNESLGDLHRRLELHVPCRDPVDLFLSMCNYRKVKFTCKHNFSFKEEVNKWAMREVERCKPNRLRFNLKQLTQPNIDLKCFQSPSRLGDYFDYMGERLQKKEVSDEYIHRDSNVARNKTEECLWNQGEEYKQKVLDYFMKQGGYLEYFQFCKECLKSDNDLLHGK